MYKSHTEVSKHRISGEELKYRMRNWASCSPELTKVVCLYVFLGGCDYASGSKCNWGNYSQALTCWRADFMSVLCLCMILMQMILVICSKSHWLKSSVECLKCKLVHELKRVEGKCCLVLFFSIITLETLAFCVCVCHMFVHGCVIQQCNEFFMALMLRISKQNTITWHAL